MSDHALTQNQKAEQLGAAIASKCLAEIRSAGNQAHAHIALNNAIQSLLALPMDGALPAAAGFSTVLVNVLERGLEAAKHA